MFLFNKKYYEVKISFILRSATQEDGSFTGSSTNFVTDSDIQRKYFSSFKSKVHIYSRNEDFLDENSQ